MTYLSTDSHSNDEFHVTECDLNSIRRLMVVPIPFMPLLYHWIYSTIAVVIVALRVHSWMNSVTSCYFHQLFQHLVINVFLDYVNSGKMYMK